MLNFGGVVVNLFFFSNAMPRCLGCKYSEDFGEVVVKANDAIHNTAPPKSLV